jgi:ATP synthase subunit 6
MIGDGLFFITLFVLYFTYLFSIKVTGGQKKEKYYIGVLLYTIMLFIWDLLNDNVNIKQHVFILYYYLVFVVVMIANIGGMIPYSLTITSYILVTFFFSAVTFLAITSLGYLFNGYKFIFVFLPLGIPVIIALLLLAIEVVSYVAKVISLSVRLFANMMSGHTLLKILVGFLWGAAALNGIFLVTAAFAIYVIILVTSLEVCVAFLQAYVYVVLLSIYLNDVLYLH